MPTDAEYEAFLKLLGARIKELRKERKLSLRDIVVKHGYQDSQWRNYESGGSLNVRSLLRIAEVLRVSLADLVIGLDKRRRPTRVRMHAALKSSKASHPPKT